MSQLVTVEKIIVHCSDSDFGTSSAINEWHHERGFDCIGYHYVIQNGHRSSKGPYVLAHDGTLDPGRDINVQGAHAYGHNHNSIGICLIGKELFSPRQLQSALPALLTRLLKTYDLKVEDIFGHYELDSKKTCPNIPMEYVRQSVREALNNQNEKGE